MTRSHDLEGELRHHGGGLHRLAAALVGAGDADDAVQEVWLEALQAPPQRPGPLGGWLRTVLQHVAWQTRRRAKRRLRRDTEVAQRRGEAADDHATAIAREELSHRLVAAVHALEPPCRDVIWRRYFEGQPPRVIAAAIGEPVATVKSRLHRGLVLLRERLGERERVDWRAGLAAAFGLRAADPVTNTAPWWPGVWWMAMNVKLGVAAALAVLVAGALWWMDASPRPSASATAPTAIATATAADAPLAPPSRTDAAPMAAASTPAAEPPPPAAAPAAPAAFAQVRGRLVDAGTKQPLAGQRVTWNRGSQLTSAPDDGGATTDRDGGFAFDVPAGARVTVVAQPPHHVGRWTGVNALQPGQLEDLGEWPMRPGRRFPVRIVEIDSGQGVGGVNLEFRYEHHRVATGIETLVLTTSAADGRCTPEALPLTTCTLAIQGGGHELVAPTSLVITGEAPAELVVTVRRRPTIRGLVVDADGAPLAGIGLSTQAGPFPELGTAADGTFVLTRQLPTADPAVTIRFVDTGLFVPPDPVPNVAWGTEGLRFELRRPSPLPIEVVDDTGAAVAAFGVSLGRPGLALGNAHLVRQRGEHAGGRLLVDGVLRGSTSLRVVPVAIELAPSEPVACGDTEPLRVVVARRSPCRVQVVRGDTPVQGALVEYVHERLPLSDRHLGNLNDPRDKAAPIPAMWPELVAAARTGADGIAALWRDATQERRALRVQVPDEPFVVVRDLVFPADGSPLRVVLHGSGRVVGRVELAGRSRKEVSMRIRAGSHEQSLDLQPDGTFTSRPLPAGPCRVDVLLLKGLGRIPIEDFGREVILVAGDTTRVEIDLGTLQLAGVRGRVTADAGLPAGLAVDLVRVGNEGSHTHGTAPVAGDGTFAIDGLWPGTYHAAFRLTNGAATFVPALQPEPIALVGGQQLARDLHFVRRKLTVRFVRPDGTPARGHRTLARCAGGRWPAITLFAPVLDETLVLDPAPALPVEFGGWASAPWSEPVQMPTDRAEAEVTVVLPGS
jgi:RNA polymerase sigma factor (sigma-70 family)